MPQVASSVSSGPAVQKADHAALQQHAHQRRGHEGHRHRRQQVPVKGTGQVALKQALHHVGGVGANHHQLAVRHVDDAHQTVGDGQAQRHQQQDAAEADAAEHRAQLVAPGQPGFHLAQRLAQGRFDRGVRLGLQVRQQHGLGAGLVAGAQQSGRLQALRLVGAAQQRGGAHQRQLVLDFGVLLGFQGLFDQRQLARVGVALHLLHGGHAHLVIFGKQLERGQGRVDLAAHAVVVDHVLGIVGQGKFSARGGIDALVVPDHDGLAAHQLDRVVGQRLQKHRGAGIGLRHGLVQGLDAGIGLAAADGVGVVHADRMGARGDRHNGSEEVVLITTYKNL